jgi:hypothetical protein
MPGLETGRAKPGPKPSGREALSIVWPIKGTREWRAWLNNLAEAHGAPPTAMLDALLDKEAKRLKMRRSPGRTGG